MSSTGSSASKLVKMLREAAGLETRRMGFGVSESHRSSRSVLVVSLSPSRADLVQAAARAGADALAVAASPSDVAHAGDAMASAAGASSGKPLGLILGDGVEMGALKAFSDRGLDFLVASADGASAAFLGVEAGRGLSIHHDLPPVLIRSLNEIPVDFVVLDAGGDAERKPLNLKEILALRLLTEGIRKPVLLSSSYLNGPDELKYFADFGLTGVLMDASSWPGTAGDLESTLGEYRKAVDALETGSRGAARQSDVVPSLPRIAPAPLHEAEEDEPDDE